MPSLLIENLPGSSSVSVSPGQTLLVALHAAGHDWAHACGGRGRCTTCRLRLIVGAEWLAPDTPAEIRFRALGRLPADSRLTCQAALRADAPPVAELRGVVPPEGQLPHVKYAAERG